MRHRPTKNAKRSAIRRCTNRKGKQWYFGMKVHIGVDTDSGLVHTHRHGGKCGGCERTGELLHGGEESLHGIRPTTPRN